MTFEQGQLIIALLKSNATLVTIVAALMLINLVLGRRL